MIDPSAYDVQVLQTACDLEGFAPEWEQFLGAAAGRQYAQEPTLVRDLCDRTPKAQPLVVVLRRGGRVHCLAPFLLTRDWVPVRISVRKLLSLPLRRLRFLGEQLSCAADAHPEDCWGRVLAELFRLGKRFDVLEFQDVEESGPLWAWLNASPPPKRLRLLHATPGQACHRVAFPEDFDHYLRALKSRDRTNLQRRKRKLWQHCADEVRLRRVSAPEEVPLYLDGHAKIIPHTWQTQVYGPGKGGGGGPPGYYAQLAERGWLRSYLLECRGEPVAFQTGIQYRDTYFFIETGYHARWADLGPGTVLEFLVIEDLCRERPPRVGDFGFGDAEYKRILGNTTHTEFAHVYVGRRFALYARLVFLLMASLEWAEARIRLLLQRAKLDRVVRNLLKHRARAPGPQE
jgi:CelD/BcsL family acetyltransferase involved in cellulose biosynthesis